VRLIKYLIQHGKYFPYDFTVSALMKIVVLTSIHPPYDVRIYHKQFVALKEKYPLTKIITPNQVEVAKNDSDYISFRGFSHFGSRIWNNVVLIRKALQYKPNIIIFHDPDLLPFMLIFRMFFAAPMVYDIHEDYPGYFRQNAKIPPVIRDFTAQVYRFLEKAAQRRLDHLIYADHLTAWHYNRPNKKISIIYNFPFLQDGKPTRRKNIDVIFQGSMHATIHSRLLDIVRQLDQMISFPLTFMVIARKPDEQIESDIRRTAAELKNVMIYFEKNLSLMQVQEYISRSKIGITPWPFTEKFSKNIATKIFEYLNHGIPQIASNTAANYEFLHQMRSGFVVDEAYYAGDFATRILEILQDYEHYAQLASADREKFLKHWNWDHSEKPKFMAIINELLAASKQ
jgi:glycosyltransferase involved in cell wall biosynthesis